ncbi:MAG TPA: metallophosphoesterase [Tepidisphaeraceae bacterium]|nr:metallophosphoesterase [Tepidisphaeraceae bacterium]
MRTIAHISDLHFGRVDPAIADGLAEDLVNRKPSLVVVSGDLTQRARQWQYQAASNFLARLPKPQLIVPGNHDIPLYDVTRRFLFPLEKYQKYITKDLWPVYKDEEMLVIGLNTARSFTFRLGGFWKDGRIDPDQLIELRRRMGEASSGVFKVLVTHHPFIPPSDHYAADVVGGAQAALEVLEQSGVELLLAGHLHLGYHGDVRGHYESANRSILSIQAGTATSTRRRDMPNAYNWITIQPDNVNIEVRAWNGGAFKTFTMTRFDRLKGVWRQAD